MTYLQHEGVNYHLSKSHLRTTIMVHTGNHVGAVTQLALPHAVAEWIAESVSTSLSDQRDKVKDDLLDAYEELVSTMISPHYRMTEIELHAQDLWSLRRRNL